MTRIANQRNRVVLADPRRDGIAVADLPVQTLFRLVYCRRDPRVTSLHDLPHLIHISLMEPRIVRVQLGGIFPNQDPVEFFAVAQRVLNQMDIVPNPDVHTFFFEKFFVTRVFVKGGAFEECSKASIPG